MMLKIGIKGSRRNKPCGFTLIEIMVAVCVLSLGTVLTLQSNMMSLSVFGRYLNRLEIIRWADHKMAETQEMIFRSETPETGISNGTMETNRRSYNWAMNIKDGDVPGLYSMHLDVSWPEGGQTAHLYRDSYSLKPKH